MPSSIRGLQGKWRYRWALAFALVVAAAGATGGGARADQSDLDALIAEALLDAPADRVAAAIRDVLALQQGTTMIHGVSPGSLWVHEAFNEIQAFPVADGRFASDGGFGGCSYAPLRFPQGSTLTGLVIWFKDNTGDNYQIEVRRRLTSSNTEGDVLAATASSGATAGVRVATDFSIENGTIDNSLYSYFVYVCKPFFESKLHGIYLTYTP